MTEWHERVKATVAAALVDDAIAHVTRMIEAGASPGYAADLALAFAAGRGDAVAVRRFEAHVGPELAIAARAIDREPAFVDEIVQRTRVQLLTGDPPRVLTYKGAGPLRAWAAIAAQRLALNAKRDGKSSAAVAAPNRGDMLAELVDREPDPELKHLKTLYRAEFREALISALAALSDRTRAVLRLRFVDGLELAQIGKLYRVHESTVSRWVATALDDIGSATRSELMRRLSVTDDTAASVARMVQSQLDLSIARLL